MSLNTNKFLLLLSLIFSSYSHAIWFEASGQAVVHNGDKHQARTLATREAIKQALLFSGASVTSVQSMANGLLQDDRFEIRANGEVNSVELISETYQGDIVTISIRADIFAQQNQCEAADYKKNIITTWFPIKHRQQAATGALFELGKSVSSHLKNEFNSYATYTNVKDIKPVYVSLASDDLAAKSMLIARQHSGQFVLFAEITELSLERNDGNVLAFWQDHTPRRHFTLTIKLMDGTTGEELLSESFDSSASWEFDLYKEIDPASNALWSSTFGQSIKMVLQNVAQQVNETVACIPAYGRIKQVVGEHVSVDIGKKEGVMMGDHLTIFKMNQTYDPFGNVLNQYQIHPVKVEVTQVFNGSSTLRSVGDMPLLNIQPNDYVVRR